MRHPVLPRQGCHAPRCGRTATVRVTVEYRSGDWQPGYQYETHRCAGCAIELAGFCLDYPGIFGLIGMVRFDPGEW